VQRNDVIFNTQTNGNSSRKSLTKI